MVGKWENRKLVCPNGPNWNVAIWSIFYSLSPASGAVWRNRRHQEIVFIQLRSIYFRWSALFLSIFHKNNSEANCNLLPRKKNSEPRRIYSKLIFCLAHSLNFSTGSRISLFECRFWSSFPEALRKRQKIPLPSVLSGVGAGKNSLEAISFQKIFSPQGCWDAPLNEFLVLSSLASLAPILCWFGERIFLSARAALWNVSWRRFIRDQPRARKQVYVRLECTTLGFEMSFFFSLRKDNEFGGENITVKNDLDIRRINIFLRHIKLNKKLFFI